MYTKSKYIAVEYSQSKHIHVTSTQIKNYSNTPKPRVTPFSLY